MLRKKKIPLVLLFFAILSLCSCSGPGGLVNTEEGYYTEIRMSEIEYETFIAKKTAPILDKLAAHAAMSTNISNGEYSQANEAKNVDVTIGIVNEAYNDVLGIGASLNREQARQNLLEQLKLTKEHLEAYKTELLNSKTVTPENMTIHASTFKNDFNAIKAF